MNDQEREREQLRFQAELAANLQQRGLAGRFVAMPSRPDPHAERRFWDQQLAMYNASVSESLRRVPGADVVFNHNGSPVSNPVVAPAKTHHTIEPTPPPLRPTLWSKCMQHLFR